MSQDLNIKQETKPINEILSIASIIISIFTLYFAFIFEIPYFEFVDGGIAEISAQSDLNDPLDLKFKLDLKLGLEILAKKAQLII
jgi:hypothetical protein